MDCIDHQILGIVSEDWTDGLKDEDTVPAVNSLYVETAFKPYTQN